MNDRRQNYRNFYYPKEIKKQQQGAEELLALMMSFLSHSELKPSDWVAVNRMIKQLEAHKNNINNKILKSFKNKFANIQKQYQR